MKKAQKPVYYGYVADMEAKYSDGKSNRTLFAELSGKERASERLLYKEVARIVSSLHDQWDREKHAALDKDEKKTIHVEPELIVYPDGSKKFRPVKLPSVWDGNGREKGRDWGRIDGCILLVQRVDQRRFDIQGGKVPMKLKITVAIEQANGEPAVQSTTMQVEIPEFEAFTSPETFGAVFDTCERQAIQLRNEAMGVAMENYLNELVKKR